MSDLLPVATMILAGLTQATLQVSFGGLILLYHSSMGRHRRRKTRILTRSYVLGAATVTFLLVCTGAFVIDRLGGALDLATLMACVGVLLGCALVMWGLYFRNGQNTELWLPRSLSRFIGRKTRSANDGVTTFMLGILSAFVELPLSISIYLVVANCILALPTGWQLLGILCYTGFVCLPMIALKLFIRTGSSAVAAQKWRIANKAFAKVLSGGCFVILGAFVLAFWAF